MTIKGENLDFVDNVTIGGTDAPIISKTDRTLVVSTLPHTASGGNAITLFDIDCSALGGTVVPGGGFNYQLTPVTSIPGTKIYVVGPGEGVEVVGTLTQNPVISCISNVMVTSTSIAPPPTQLPGVAAFKVEGSFDCSACTCNLPSTKPCPRTESTTMSFTLANSAAPNDSRLRRAVQRTANVPFDFPPLPGQTRTCNGSF